MARHGNSAESKPPPGSYTREIILTCVEQLPPLPPEAVRLLTNNDAARSAIRYGASLPGFQNVDVIGFAGRLGGNLVPALSVARAVDDTLFADTPITDRPAGRTAVWRHGLQVAALADCLTDEISTACNRTALLAAALLHDVGQLLFLRFTPKSYARLMRQSRLKQQGLRHVERNAFGFDHAAAGSALAEHWQLPQSVQHAIGAHHRGSVAAANDEPQSAEQSLMQLAEAAADGPRIAHHEPLDRDTRSWLCDQLGISADALDWAKSRAVEKSAMLIDQARPILCLSKAASQFTPDSRPSAGLTASRTSWQPDDIARRYLAAMHRFWQTVDLTGGLATLCREMVRCVAETLRTDTTAAFAVDPDSHTCHYAVLQDDHVHCDAFLPNDVPPPAAAQTPGPPPLRSTPDSLDEWGAVLTKPRGLAQRVRDRYRHHWTSPRLMALATTTRGRQIGGILLEADFTARLDPTIWREVLESLREAFAAAIRQAARARRLARDVDRLTDLNDRLVAGRDALIESRAFAKAAEMAAGAAHEWNTPLAVISGRAQLLARNATDAGVQTAAATIEQHARRCSDIVSETLAFARPESPRPRLSTLKPLLDDVIERTTGKTAERPADVSINMQEPSVAAWIDPEQLTTALQAIITNALHAMPPEKGRLVINSPSHPSDDWVVIEVEDNGRGMPPDVLERAFDPFFSQRPAGRGRGLGLSIARRLIELNHGRVRIDSTPGHGTKVTLSLPTAPPNNP